MSQRGSLVFLWTTGVAFVLGTTVLASACGGASTETQTAAVSCSPAGAELRVLTPAEKSHTFDTKCLAAPAGKPFTITYTNEDTSWHGQHNIAIKGGGDYVFEGEIIGGRGRKITYDVPALPAGTYTFLCTKHTFMNGVAVVA